MLAYVPISFVFRHMVSVDVLESVLDRSPCDSLGNVRKPLQCIHGNGVPDLLFAEDYYNQKALSLLFLSSPFYSCFSCRDLPGYPCLEGRLGMCM